MSPATERHYTVSEVADLLQLSENMVRSLFRDVPGVLRISTPRLASKRPYTTVRIPESVLASWHDSHSGRAAEVQPRRRLVKQTLVRRNERSIVPLRGLDGGVA